MNRFIRKVTIMATVLLVMLSSVGLCAYALESFEKFPISDDEKVLASFDAKTNTITIDGEGVVSFNKWVDMAQKINDKNFTRYGFKYFKDVNIEFINTDKDIILNKVNWVNSYDETEGMFQNVCGHIKFNENVNITGCTNTNYMFYNASGFTGTTGSGIGHFDTSLVNSMASMFEKSGFNADINAWDVSNVENMASMFSSSLFNGELSSWDVSNVNNMAGMFSGNKVFNQPITEWNTESLTNTFGMFRSSNFNSKLILDTSKVTTMAEMFMENKVFNQPLDSFNTSRVLSMKSMFNDAKKFNQPLSHFDVSNVTDTKFMFWGASSFDQDISNWDVRKISWARMMFQSASSFDQDLSSWEFNSLYNGEDMFNSARNMSEVTIVGQRDGIQASNLLNGTLADEIYISRLSFQFRPRLEYTVKKTRRGSSKSTTETWEKNTTHQFDENYTYELSSTRKVPRVEAEDFQKVYDGKPVLKRNIRYNNWQGVYGDWKYRDLENGDIINPGTYTINYKFIVKDFKLAKKFRKKTGQITVTINKKPLTVTLGEGASIEKEYDGDEKAENLPLVLSGIIDGDDVSISSCEAQYDSSRVGTDKPITVTGVLLTGTDADKYIVDESSLGLLEIKGNIKPRTITVGVQDNFEIQKVYDGTPDATVEYKYDGIVDEGIDVSGVSATFNSVNAGKGMLVTLSGGEIKEINGDTDAEKNYVLSYVEGLTGTILKKAADPAIPTGITAYQNQSVGQIRLGDVEDGSWEFVDKDRILREVGIVGLKAKFTPVDANYSEVIKTIDVTVRSNPQNDEEEGEDNQEESGGVVVDETETPLAIEIPFIDVLKGDWFYSAVEYVYQNNILKGVSTDEFGPYLDVRRGMIITGIYNMNKTEKTMVANTKFNDIKSGSYYENPVKWGEKNELVFGDGVSFFPQHNSTREEMVAMFYRYATMNSKAEYESTGKVSLYKDASDISEYAKKPMDWAVSVGLIEGRSKDLLAPTEHLKRSELAAFLERFDKLMK